MLIDLHKILLVFLLPTGLTLMLVVAGLVLRRRALCWIGVAVFWSASTSLLSNSLMRAAEGWQVRQPLSEVPAAQAIIVLSEGRIQPPGDPNVSEWVDADRFYAGVELYKANKAPLLIFTSGWNPLQPNAKPEGEVLIRFAADLGIALDHMLTTAKATNTEEESRAVAALIANRLDANTAPRVLLVTSAFHMRRAQMLFARANLETVPFPVDFKASTEKTFTPLDLLPNGQNLGMSEIALKELYGRAYYWLFRG